MPDETKPAKPAKESKPAAAPGDKPAKAAGEAKPDKKKVAPGAEAGAAPAAATPAAPLAANAPTAAELLGEDPNAKKIIKAKHAKNISSGVANILATFNNTQVTITDHHGNLLGWSSGGPACYSLMLREKTPFAGAIIAMSTCTSETSAGSRVNSGSM